jgi:glycosyltransferase involved in cell wall biosynthesis
MKKLIFFVPTFSNLSETFILREIDSLVKRKNLEIMVLSLNEGKAFLPENLKDKIYYIPLKFSDITRSIPFVFKNLGNLFRIGWTFFRQSEDSFLRNVNNFIKAIFFASKISQFKFDHIHIHFMSDISTIISLASQILGKPFSISGHARDILLDSSAVKFKVKHAKFITLCNTKAFLKCLELSGGKGRKNVVLAFHGIDSSAYEFKNRVLKATSEINVLTDGRFTPKKGLTYLSQAIVSLIKDYNFKINLTIIGLAVGESQNQTLHEVKQIFKNAGLYDKLHIPGNGAGIQQDEVRMIYRDSDIFIYAGINDSNGDADGVPNGLLQAAYSGLPVITTTSGSISDLFNEKNSYIIDQKSPESIIEKFNELIIDKHLHNKTKILYDEVSESFGQEKNISYLETLLLK